MAPLVQLDAEAAAARVTKKTGRNLSAASWRAYVSRGIAPKPTGYLGRTPWWSPAAVDAFVKSRPGQGAGGGPKPKAVPEPAASTA